MDNPLIQELSDLLLQSVYGYIAGTTTLEEHENNASIWWNKAEEEGIDKQISLILFNKLITEHHNMMRVIDEEDEISESIPELEEQ